MDDSQGNRGELRYTSRGLALVNGNWVSVGDDLKNLAGQNYRSFVEETNVIKDSHRIAVFDTLNQGREIGNGETEGINGS